MTINHFYLILFVLILSVLSLEAEIKIASLQSSNMALQRSITVKILDKASAGEEITVQTSWNNVQHLTSYYDLFNDWSKTLYIPWGHVFTADLKEAKHTIRLRMSYDKKNRKQRYCLSNLLFYSKWI